MSTTLSVCPVILAGGSGTRLWPLSRAHHPKQFLCLDGSGDSLLQAVAGRMHALGNNELRIEAPIVITNQELRFLVLDQMRAAGRPPAAVILEPVGRNTAPAVALAAAQAGQDGADPVLVVTPADQAVRDGAAFTQALRHAVALAAEGGIAILGVPPLRPETGYGYIRADEAGDRWQVVQFVEKPDAETAARYVADGRYFWNSGMFVMRASVWRAALQTFRPDIAAAVDVAWQQRRTDGAFIRPGVDAFAAVPAESVDYAVLEKCPGSGTALSMVPLQAGWSDLGAWDAVWQAAPRDAHGNAVTGDTLLMDSRNTLVHASSRLVAVVGLDDVVVVETPDAVLVTLRNRSQDVKRIVSALEAQGRGEKALHRKVHRPWGWYDSVDQGERFQVKRILVNPGASLSLQKHHHRAEHWIVVSGTAEVTCGERVLLLTENQSTYIPLGEVHRLANPGKMPLELIEVQSGSYLGEDDIVRFEDTYGRVAPPA